MSALYALPSDALHQIFSYLTIREVARAESINGLFRDFIKREVWKRIYRDETSDPTTLESFFAARTFTYEMIDLISSYDCDEYKKPFQAYIHSFGPKEWKTLGVEAENPPRLPLSVHKQAQDADPFSDSNETIGQNYNLILELATTNGVPLRLELLQELAKNQEFNIHQNIYAPLFDNTLTSEVLSFCRNISVPVAQWKWVRKKIIQNSTGLDYEAQVQRIEAHPGFHVIGMMDAFLSSVASYARTKELLFAGHLTRTRDLIDIDPLGRRGSTWRIGAGFAGYNTTFFVNIQDSETEWSPPNPIEVGITPILPIEIRY